MRPPGLLVVSYGGGVNSVAALLHLHRLGEPPPRAIVMADPGSERRATWAYLHEVMQPRLRAWGWPEVQVCTRKAEGALRKALPASRGARRLETLLEECQRTSSLPSIAYGPKKCSQKYKAQTQRWFLQRQQWANDEWAAGRRLVRVIGYDFDEPKRVQRGVLAMANPNNAWEAKRFNIWYPVFEARMTRAACIALVQSEGMPVPPKSACTFCPSSTLEEWQALRVEEPEAFEAAVAMSRAAIDGVDVPDVVGLMRCNRKGSRQLHEWVDGKYAGLGPLFDEERPSMSCECSL